MKYFKYDLFLQDNEEEWNKNNLEYSKVFNEIKDNLSESFLEIYFKEYGFHDKKITNISFVNNVLKIKIALRYSGFAEIEYSGVDTFSFNADISNSESLEWGYDEFGKTVGNKFVHSILILNGTELEIHFNSIKATYIYD